MKQYSTIIFDLFDTIVNFNFNHLPTVEIKGLRSRTTSTEVFEVFRQYYSDIEFEEFYEPFIESYHEFLEIKSIEFKEYPNRDRYILMLDKMNLEPTDQQNSLIDKMVLAHMDGLASCVELPKENKRTLEYIKSREYTMAIVSNFDYAPTAYMLLNKFEITNLFEEVVISEEVGWRKPKDIIFQTALNKLDIHPSDALFVGDNYDADVVGSKALGIDAAWINKKDHPENDLNPNPDYIIKTLSELMNIL